MADSSGWTRAILAWLCILICPVPGAQAAEDALSVYISVDMEGITGIGVSDMTRANGKDYAVGRRMMTRELNAVIAGIRSAAEKQGWPAPRILVNDAHGDQRNVLIEELAPEVEYIQGDVKPVGMVQGLDETFDAAIFLGYHARASTRGFLAHTGSGSVRDLSINGVPCGEGEINAAYAGALGVPVVMVAGDQAYLDQAATTYASKSERVATKVAITGSSAQVRPVDVVLGEMTAAAEAAMLSLDEQEPWRLEAPYRVEMELSRQTHVDIAVGVPTVERSGPHTVRFENEDMVATYALIRILYKFLSV